MFSNKYHRTGIFDTSQLERKPLYNRIRRLTLHTSYLISEKSLIYAQCKATFNT